MAEAQLKLGYILDPLFQIENTNGKPVVGGHIEVYEAGTDVKYITYQNFDYTQNPFKIPLGSDGRAVVLGDSDLSYDVYIYDSFNNIIVSRLNVAAGDAGGVAGGGLREVIHDNTMTGKGTQLSPLGVSPLTNLAVDETMTAYEATVEGKDSLVLGVNGDWFNNQFGSDFSGKVDWSAFNSAYSGLIGDISSKADWSALNNYYTKNETYNTFLPRSAFDINLSNYYTKEEVFNKEETRSLLDSKEDKLNFGYNDSSAISSINGSALAGQDDNCPWISGSKVIADTQTLTSNMIIQVLSSFDLSGYKNHNIGVKGGTYRFPNEYEIGSALLHTNYFMHLSGMSGYLPISSFSSYTASISNNLQSNWDYTNSAYSLSINNFYNKLDISAFSSYSAGQELIINDISGQIINISAASGNYYPMTGNPSGFLTAHQSLTNYYTKTDTSSKQEISAALQYISANAGHTYTGDEPIYVNNETNHIGITGESLSAGPGIDIFSSGGYVVISGDGAEAIKNISAGEGILVSSVGDKTIITNNISAGEGISLVYDQDTNKIRIDVDNSIDYELSAGNGVTLTDDNINKITRIDCTSNVFPMTGTDGTANYTANANFSSFTLTTGQGAAGCYVNMDAKGVRFEAYPSTDVSASWYNIITHQDKITCSAVKLSTAANTYTFQTSALPNLNKITFIAPTYGPYQTYSALINDGETEFKAEVDSGCIITVVKAWNDNRNKDVWCGLGTANYEYLG